MSATRVVGLASAFVLLVAACGGDDSDEVGSSPTPTEPAGQEVTIVAEDYSYSDAPEELSAGVVELTFQNDGEVAHEVALVEIGDTELADFLTEFPAVLEGGPFPAYAEQVAVPIEAEGGATLKTTFTVGEGTFALFCTLDGATEADAATATTAAGAPGEGEEGPTGPPHFALGMAQTITVGPGDAGELPAADATITAKDYSFEADVSAGDRSVTFVNDGPDEVHFAGISVFPEGTDDAAAEAAFTTLLQLPEDQPPPDDLVFPEDVGFSGIFSAGLGSRFELPGEAFEAGRTYVLACFIQDRAGGPPHAIANNMFTVFTVE